MKLHATFALVLLTVALVGCGRANPRLKRIASTGPLEGPLATFTYDEDNHPVVVEKLAGEMTLTFEGSRLVSAFDDRKLDFDYEDDRLVSVRDDTTDVAIAYDDAGRVVTLGSRTFTYGEGLESISQEGEGLLARFTWDGGELREAALGERTVTFTYDGGRVSESKLDGAENSTHFEYGDDGFLSRLFNDDATGAATIFEYETGDVADVDITPGGTFLPFTPLWDLRGVPHRDLDLRTQLVRLVGVSW